MSGKRYADEFKIEAVRRVTVRGHKVADVAQRLGITTHSLYACDVPPILSSTVFWSPITRDKEIVGSRTIPYISPKKLRV